MTFKVIIRHPSEEGDEHTYYGIAFLNPGKIKSGRLKYSQSENKLKVALTFDGNPIKVGDKFLAILVPVNESEITESTTPEFKIGENSPAPVPEVVDF
jgi:hypothetical protein